MSREIKSIAHLPDEVQDFLEAVAYILLTEYPSVYDDWLGDNFAVIKAAKKEPSDFAATMVYLSAAISPADRERADAMPLLSAIRQKAEDIMEEVRVLYRLPDEDGFGPDENGNYPTEDEKNQWREEVEVRLEQEADRKAAREAA